MRRARGVVLRAAAARPPARVVNRGISMACSQGETRAGSRSRRTPKTAPKAAASRPRSKLPSMKVIIIAAAGLLVLGGGGGGAYLHVRRAEGRARPAAAAGQAARSSSICPTCWSTCPTPAPTARNISRSRSCSNWPTRAWSRRSSRCMPRVMDAFQTYLRELRADRSRRLGRPLPAQGRTDAPRQRRDRAEPDQRRAVQGNRRPVTALTGSHGRTTDQIDQDALAAEWGLALEADDAATPAPTPTAAAEARRAAPMRPTAQWAAMVDDGMPSSCRPPRAAPSASSTRTRSTACSASAWPTSRSTTSPASARSSTRRWSPTSVCRCSKSSSTAWSG